MYPYTQVNNFFTILIDNDRHFQILYVQISYFSHIKWISKMITECVYRMCIKELWEEYFGCTTRNTNKMNSDHINQISGYIIQFL